MEKDRKHLLDVGVEVDVDLIKVDENFTFEGSKSHMDVLEMKWQTGCCSNV